LYRNKRYNLDFSLAIGLSYDQINLEKFIDSKRKTDNFIHLEDYLYCMVLDGASYESAIKATSNLQTQFQTQYFNKKLYIAVVASSEFDNENIMVNSLFDILEYSISHNMDNMVIDKSQMLLDKH
jgi:hypothetical protein